MKPNRIAIIGATGMLGRPVTKALIDAGNQVLLLARDPEKAQATFPRSHVMNADMEDYRSLKRGLKGTEAVYINLNIESDERPGDFHAETKGLELLIKAAQKEGVKRIAMISSLVKDYNGKNGFSWWVFDIKQKAVEILKASGIPYLIFYPSSFMENLVFHNRRGNKINWIGDSKQKMHYISAVDYGKQVAKAFAIIEDGESKEYAVQGPEALTGEEAALKFISASQDNLSFARVSPFTAKLIGFFSHELRYASKITEALNNYQEPFQAENTWEELGKPEITIERFAKEIAPGLESIKDK